MQGWEEEEGCLRGRSQHPTGGVVTSIGQVSNAFLISHWSEFPEVSCRQQKGGSQCSFFLRKKKRKKNSPIEGPAEAFFSVGWSERLLWNVEVNRLCVFAQVVTAAAFSQPAPLNVPCGP